MWRGQRGERGVAPSQGVRDPNPRLPSPAPGRERKQGHSSGGGDGASFKIVKSKKETAHFEKRNRPRSTLKGVGQRAMLFSPLAAPWAG